jgi:hypothetical protein
LFLAKLIKIVTAGVICPAVSPVWIKNRLAGGGRYFNPVGLHTDCTEGIPLGQIGASGNLRRVAVAGMATDERI